MPLSISNSRERVSSLYTPWHLLVGVVMGLALLVALELQIRHLGGTPQIRDSKELWAVQRDQAAVLGKKALIIVGASRIQLGLDLNHLRHFTGLQPVQLAIDGSYMLPVLTDLVTDPEITGAILVSATADQLIPHVKRDRAVEWVEFYQRNFRNLLAPKIETFLKTRLMSESALYSSALPLVSLPEIVSGRKVLGSFGLTTYSSREKDADYSQAAMPIYYINRALGHLDPSKTEYQWNSLDAFLVYMRQKIAQLTPMDQHHFNDQLSTVLALTRHYVARGGKMAFVRMPTDKHLWLIDEKKAPKAQFWDRFSEKVAVPTVHFKEFDALRSIALPDGSHMDQKDKRQFTNALIAILTDKHFF